jgi:hypothetical protein
VNVLHEDTEFEPYDEPEQDYGPIPHASRDNGSEAPSGRLSRSLLYGGIGLLVVIAGFVGIMRSRRSAPTVPVIPPIKTAPYSRPGPTAESAPAPAPRTPVQRVIPPENPAIPPPSAPSTVAGRKGTGWSVIAATYNSRELAERRAQAMTRRWPAFRPGVSQSGNSHFVVVLGENLSQDQAAALLKRAVSAGLPRDTFISRTN